MFSDFLSPWALACFGAAGACWDATVLDYFAKEVHGRSAARGDTLLATPAGMVAGLDLNDRLKVL